MVKYAIGFVTCAILSLGMTAGAARADEKAAPGGKHQEWLDAAARKLALSDQQQQEIRKIQADCKRKVEPLEKQMETLHQEEHEAMSKVLTADQRNKLPEVMRTEWDKECQRMGAKLGLSADQKQRIDKIREEYQPKFRELFTQKGENMRERFHELRSAFLAAVCNDLNDEQRVRLPYVLHEEMARMHETAGREQMQKDIEQKLELSADQKDQIRKIKSQYEPKLEKPLTELKQLHKDEHAQLDKVLTAEQRTKLQELRKEKARE